MPPLPSPPAPRSPLLLFVLLLSPLWKLRSLPLFLLARSLRAPGRGLLGCRPPARPVVTDARGVSYFYRETTYWLYVRAVSFFTETTKRQRKSRKQGAEHTRTPGWTEEFHRDMSRKKRQPSAHNNNNNIVLPERNETRTNERARASRVACCLRACGSPISCISLSLRRLRKAMTETSSTQKYVRCDRRHEPGSRHTTNRLPQQLKKKGPGGAILDRGNVDGYSTWASSDTLVTSATTKQESGLNSQLSRESKA